MSVERTIAAVIQMFLSLTGGGGQGAIETVIGRDLHLQTRIAKHLHVPSDTRVGSEECTASSPFYYSSNHRTKNDLNG
jgi:hypothetical protein